MAQTIVRKYAFFREAVMRSTDKFILLRPSRNLLHVLFVTLIAMLLGNPVSAGSLKSPDELEKAETKKEVDKLVKLKAITAEQASKAMKAGRARRNRRSRASQRIVNGVGTVRYAATGALLKGADRKSATAWCSGTLIGCSTFLTAAHCFDEHLETRIMDTEPDPANFKVFFQSGGIFDVTEIHYQKNKYRFPDSDVAVLRLARPVEGIVPLLINKTVKPIDGTIGLIVGFGRTGGRNQDYGIKRRGAIKTASCTGDYSDTTLICWNYDARVGPPGEDSNTCNGDSGGGFHIGRKSIVSGVTSGGVRSSCQTGDRSYDANVYHYHKWIETVSAGDLSTRACGALPAIDERKHIRGETERLSTASPEASYKLDVPAGSSRFRVAMNGEDDGEGQNNFDLYLIRGAAPNPNQAVCAENGSGQFGYCEIKNPRPGPWTILVRRIKGDGLVQVTVTVLPKS